LLKTYWLFQKQPIPKIAFSSWPPAAAGRGAPDEWLIGAAQTGAHTSMAPQTAVNIERITLDDETMTSPDHEPTTRRR
jgi:hypothetical protein